MYIYRGWNVGDNIWGVYLWVESVFVRVQGFQPQSLRSVAKLEGDKLQ